MALRADNTMTEGAAEPLRHVMFPDTFDYALVASAARTEPVSRSLIRESLFDIQDDLNRLPPSNDSMIVLHRELEPWSRFDETRLTHDPDLEFTVGIGNGDIGNERFRPIDPYTTPVATLLEAQRNLIQVLRTNPREGRVCIVSRPSPHWQSPPGAQAAVDAVAEHMRAATAGEFEVLRRLATGPLLAEIDTLTDNELAHAVHGVYDSVPSVMVLARSHNRPGHHHVLTNSTLHFDVDDSTGTWLIRQVRLMKRSDRFGTLLGCWQPLLIPPSSESPNEPG